MRAELVTTFSDDEVLIAILCGTAIIPRLAALSIVPQRGTTDLGRILEAPDDDAAELESAQASLAYAEGAFYDQRSPRLQYDKAVRFGSGRQIVSIYCMAHGFEAKKLGFSGGRVQDIDGKRRLGIHIKRQSAVFPQNRSATVPAHEPVVYPIARERSK
jgi:hypothetical protein